MSKRSLTVSDVLLTHCSDNSAARCQMPLAAEPYGNVRHYQPVATI